MQDIFFYQIVKSLFIPNQCIICHSLNECNLCDQCLLKIPNTSTLWINSSSQNPPLFKPFHNTSIQELKDSPLQSILSCASIHHPIVRKSIHYLKYKNLPQLANPLGSVMLQRFSQCLSTLNSPLICPIPLHKNRLAFRGYNQAELLSRPLAQALNIETYTELYRIIETPQQMRIQNKQERISNMLNAFKANSSHSSFQPILLIDDVTTTLSTLQAAAKALQRQGFINIHALVLAH